jgi:hypothetical protein
MHKYNVILTTVTVLLLLAAEHTRAQDTNAPKTTLEAFEARIGTVIVKGSALIGTVSAQTGTVAVRCKESIEISSGLKEYGVAVGLQAGTGPEYTTVIDYDELESFLKGIEYIIKVNPAAMSLPEFVALYTTRGELRISVYTSHRRPGTIQVALQSDRFDKTRSLLSTDQLAQFENLIRQARDKLDFLRTNSQS